MRILYTDEQGNPQIDEVTYAGWEPDALQDGSAITGLSVFVVSIDRSVLFKDVTKEEFNTMIIELAKTGFIDLQNRSYEPYPEPGDEFSIIF